eukprot:CAMPEP_0181303358 /NCGR_PEP_ID=MMETSP1101-20121128/8512_1 /TAXON_ID=46948 /ORGANISM="Rhodomonas abbreviata, Strain Caron Lab Isolate" /LENGTH=92 /DNA_ID=CAMNT_0023408919 /DNA_START=825 /DNA_END=1100 /DNA_ORIENTATION=+
MAYDISDAGNLLSQNGLRHFRCRELAISEWLTTLPMPGTCNRTIAHDISDAGNLPFHGLATFPMPELCHMGLRRVRPPGRILRERGRQSAEE